MQKLYTHQKIGFTIVELLIAIVVIVILASIALVAYNGIRAQAVDSIVQSTVRDTTKKLEEHNITHGTYPETLLAIGFNNTDTVTLQYTQTASPKSYCVSGTSPKSTTIAYHINSASPDLTKGVCEDHTPPGSAQEAEPPNLARTVHGDGGLGLTVGINHEWTQLSLSWAPQTNIQRYEIEVQHGAGAPWYYVLRTNGTSACATSCGSDRTNNTPASTQSFTWTGAIPVVVGTVYSYRIRSIDTVGTASAWDTATLHNPVQADTIIPSVKNFKVTPSANWLSMQVSWDPVWRFAANMNEVYYEVQARTTTPTVGTWYYVNKTNGTGTCSTSCSSSYTNSITSDTSSLTWTGSIPNGVGTTMEYQIRTRAGSFYSEWKTTSLANPILSSAPVPAVTGFSITPNADWSSATLSWNQAPNFAHLMNQVSYELEVRPYLQTEGTWRDVLQSNGGSCGTYSTNCTKSIPYTTTQLTWTNWIPNGIGSGNEYRIRIRAGNISSPSGYMFYGPWTTISLANPIQPSSTIPSVSGFTVTPSADWSTINLSWNQVPNFAYVMSQVSYELEVRSLTPSVGTWRDVLQSNGGSCGTYSTNCTKSIPYTTTQLTWTSWVPSSGASVEYRIRVRAGSVSSPAGYMYYGPWTITSLSR